MNDYSMRGIRSQPNPAPSTPILPDSERFPHRSVLLRQQLGYAHRRKPTFPCEGKRPLTQHGFKDASTDPRRITAWRHRWPNANIGMPTGEASGVFALDVDRLEALEELEREHGKLPDTLTVRTPSGGLHLDFRHVEGITNSPGGLPAGIDVRGEGGYVLVPPSAGYEWESRSEVAEAPEWLLELIRTRPQTVGERPKATAEIDGGPIPEGRRNQSLASICGRLHDGTRDLPQLVADLHAINEERCDPPLPSAEVEKIARSIHRKAPCSPRRMHDPQVDEVLEAAGLHWYESYLPKSGRNKLRDLARAHLEAAAEFGRITTVVIDGETRRAVRYSESVRELRLRARTSKASVSRYNTRLVQDGVVVRETGGRGDKNASTYLIVEPAPKINSHNHASREVGIDAESFSLAHPPRPDELVTPCYPWRSIVGNARGGTLDALEAYGPQTVEELAERLGYSRPRDLRRKHLEPLAEMGLVENRDGRWGIVADYAEATRSVAQMRAEKIVRSVSPSEGRVVADVVEAPSVEDWDRRARRVNDEERERRREDLARKALWESVEAEEECRELLNDLDRELDRVASADGLISELEHADLYLRLSRTQSGWNHADDHLESLGFGGWLEITNPEPVLESSTRASQHDHQNHETDGSDPPEARTRKVG